MSSCANCENDFSYELTDIRKNLKDNEFVLGLDEVGYGSAVGPLCVAGVILPNDKNVFNDLIKAGVKDSKKLSPKKREILAEKIKDVALTVIVEFGSVEDIDTLNVLKTNMNLMTKIINKITPEPTIILIDGIHKPAEMKNQKTVKTIPKGDGKSLTIAAASIIAKVTRDSYMKDLVNENRKELEFYGVEKNMGYLSREHRDALDHHGRSKFHRQSYKYKWQK